MAQPQRDRFGNEYMLVSCKDTKGTGYGKGYIEIKGQLYKVESSEAKKDGVSHWVKITKIDKKAKPNKW